MDKIFKAFADKNRRLILTFLKERDLTVTEIVAKLDINQGTVSSHLAILRKAKLISCEIKGKNRIYKINKEILELFVKQLSKFFGVSEVMIEDELILRR